MDKINIIGRGNVASHLYKAFKDKADVTMINPRTLEGLNPQCDLILICVADNAVREVASILKHIKTLKAHTAGSIPLSVFEDVSDNVGVFYPLQTFTKDIPLEYHQIPVFIEGTSPETVERLKHFASLFTSSIHEADSEARKNLHLASVFACNFTNALAGVAQEILKDTDIDFRVVLPLMSQTVDKLHALSPAQAQTGPAVRGDSIVLEKHLKMLENKPEIKELYALISKIIMDKNTPGAI